MCLKICNLVYGVGNDLLSTTEKSIFARLALLAHKDGTSIFPSYNFIASQTGFERETVIRSINKLVDKAFLKKERRGGKFTNLYQINIQTLKINQQKEDRGIQRLVTQDHPTSDLQSLPLVTQDHLTSDCRSLTSDSGSLIGHIKDARKPIKLPQSGVAHFPKDKLKKKERINIKDTHKEKVCVNKNSLSQFQQQEKDFNALVEIWPKKEKLEAAKQIYKSLISSGEASAEQIFKAAKQKVRSLEAKYSNKDERIRYCPNLKKWLEEKGYFDSPHIASTSSLKKSADNRSDQLLLASMQAAKTQNVIETPRKINM